MQIVHILWSGRIGGKERAVYQLARSQLGRSRFHPAVAFGQAKGFYVEKFRELGCPVVDLEMRRGGDLLRIPSIAAKLKPFAMHHFHSAEGTIMLGSALCSKATRLYTHRGGLALTSVAKRLGYRAIGLLLRTCFHGLAGNTRHAAFAGSSLTGIPQSQWSVTCNGLDFSLLEPAEPSPLVASRHRLHPGNNVIIGTSANLRPLKRIELLLEACVSLPKDRFQLLIVGDGPDRTRLEHISRELGVRENTVFTGMQPHIGDYLALMDIFVLPSGPQESFGNSVVEAMAVGLPPIVFQDGGGLPEHIRHGHTGFTVNSVEELATTLRDLMFDAEKRRLIGRQAAQHVRQAYSLDSMVLGYEAFYNWTLGRRGGDGYASQCATVGDHANTTSRLS